MKEQIFNIIETLKVSLKMIDIDLLKYKSFFYRLFHNSKYHYLKGQKEEKKSLIELLEDIF